SDAATAPCSKLRREIRGFLTGGGVLGGWAAAGCVGVGGIEFVDVLSFFSSMDNPPLVKNNFRSVRPYAIKDLSIRYADNRLASCLRKQYNYANSDQTKLIRRANGEPI